MINRAYLRRNHQRNDQGILERWFNFILFFFAYIILFALLLDGVFFIIMQSSLDFMARQIAYRAATIIVTPQESGSTPAELAEVRCQKAFEHYNVRGSFLGYTNDVRTQFLAQVSAGAKEESQIDRSTERKGIGNGCYFKYEDEDKLVRMIIIIEGKRLSGAGIWPIFTRGLLDWFGKEAKVLYGRASYIAEPPRGGSFGHLPLENKLNRSLNVYGVTIDSFIPAPNPFSDENIAITDHFDVENIVVGQGLPTKESGGLPVGFQRLTLHSPEEAKLPLVISSMIYQWKSESTFCGMLQLDKWDRSTAANGFKWKLTPSEFLDIGQGTAALLPCWEGECQKANNIESHVGSGMPMGRYVYNDEMAKHYLPAGVLKKDSRQEDYFFARTANLDGDNGPLVLRKDSTVPGEEDRVKFICAFNALEATHKSTNGQDKNSAIIQTVIDNDTPTHGVRPTNPPLRNCPSMGDAPADTGPYEEIGCARPTESWDAIKELHRSHPNYQNPLDRFLPYYKYADTCPMGTPQCGYFGTSNPKALSAGGNASEWYYKYSDNDGSRDPVPQVTFEMKGRLMTNSSYTRQNDRFRIKCAYKRNAVLQHCCNGTSGGWCNSNFLPGSIMRTCECTAHSIPCIPQDEGPCLDMQVVWNIFNGQKYIFWDIHGVEISQRSRGDIISNAPNRPALKTKTCCKGMVGGAVAPACEEIGALPHFNCTYLSDYPPEIALVPKPSIVCDDDNNERRYYERCEILQ